MIRIRLTTKDLGNVRFAVSPLVHMASSAALRPNARESSTLLERQRSIFSRLSAKSDFIMNLRTVPGFTFPDFITPVLTEPEPSLPDLLDAMTSTEARKVASDLEPWSGTVHEAAARLAEGGHTALHSLAGAIYSYHQDALADDWPAARRVLRAEVARRTRDLGQRGLGYVLNSIHPRLWWNDPFLGTDLTTSDLPEELTSNGSGLVLIPSIWWSTTFSMKINQHDPLVVVYPIAGRSPLSPLPRRNDDIARLVHVLGDARSRLLVEIGRVPGANTSTLAASCRMSVSSVSEHIHALRAARLVRSERDRNSVRHELTTLGEALIRS